MAGSGDGILMPTPRPPSLSLLAFAAAAALGCADQSAPPRPLRVGAILALTGPARYLGEPERAVLLGLADERAAFNGFTLDIRDSGGDPVRARALLDTFAADPEIVAVIGPSTSAESIELGARADAHEIALLSLAANKRIVLNDAGSTRKWVFKFAQNDDLAADRMAAAMRANGHTTAALLFSDDVFGNGGAVAFRAAAGTSIQLMADVSYASRLQNAGPVVSQIDMNVPAVVIWGTTPGPARIVRELRARSYAGRIYLSHGSASGFFLQDAGAAASGAYTVGSRLLLPEANLLVGRPQDDVIRVYQALWARVGAGAPSTFGGHAYDALEAIIKASGIDLRDMEPATRRRELRNRLEALKDHYGVTGTFSFSPGDHAGLTPDAFALYRIENGRFAVAGS